MANGKNTLFDQVAKAASWAAGRPATFLLAVGLIAVWAITGPFFNFNNTWQLVINTGTTIITFLMVFLIQSTQNRDTTAIQIKLDELIRAVRGAHNTLLDLEELDEDELAKIRNSYEQLAARARRKVANGEADVDCPPVEGEANSQA